MRSTCRQLLATAVAIVFLGACSSAPSELVQYPVSESDPSHTVVRERDLARARYYDLAPDTFESSASLVRADDVEVCFDMALVTDSLPLARLDGWHTQVVTNAGVVPSRPVFVMTVDSERSVAASVPRSTLGSPDLETYACGYLDTVCSSSTTMLEREPFTVHLFASHGSLCFEGAGPFAARARTLTLRLEARDDVRHTLEFRYQMAR